MSKKISQDSELQTLTLSPSSPTSPPLQPSGLSSDQSVPHGSNTLSSNNEVGHKSRSAINPKTKNEKSDKNLLYHAKAKQSGDTSSGGQAGRVSSGGSGHTTSTKSASKDANSSSAATNVTVMVQQAHPSSQLAHQSKQHQSLVQSSSIQNTPKRKTERVLSVPGNASATTAVISSSATYNKQMDTSVGPDNNKGQLFHHYQQQHRPSRPVAHHQPLGTAVGGGGAATTRSRAPQPNLTTNAPTTHGGAHRSDGTPASGRSTGSPLPPPPTSTQGSASSSPFRKSATSAPFPAPPQRSPPRAERIELGNFRNPLTQASTPSAGHTSSSGVAAYAEPAVTTTCAGHTAAPVSHLVNRPLPSPSMAPPISLTASPGSGVARELPSFQPQAPRFDASPVSSGGAQIAPDRVSTPSSLAVPVCRDSVKDPNTAHQPIKLESLHSNITLRIKPEAIHSAHTRPPHTALLIEPELDPGFVPAPRNSPVKRLATSHVPPSRGAASSQAVIPVKSEPLRPNPQTTTCVNMGMESEKPTSLLTQLLSQSTKETSSRSASDILKFWTDSRTPKKPNFGSNVALAGSNDSNSDSIGSELSESSNADKQLLRSNFFQKNSSGAGFASGLATETSSMQALGSRSSLNTPANARNFPLPKKGIGNNRVSEECRGLLMSEPLLESRSQKDWFATELSRFADEGALDVMSSATAPLNPDLLQLDEDDDEAWFDNVTKLNEQWFRPGKNGMTLASGTAMTATPVGKSDVARLSGFGVMGRSRGTGTVGDGDRGVIGRSSTTTDLQQKIGSSSRLESSSSFAALTSPLAGLPTRRLSPTTPPSGITLSTKPTRSTLDLTNLACDKSGASNSSTNATFGSNAALANASTSNLAARSSHLNLTSNRSNIAALRKVLHQRGLYQRRLHTKTHANLIKTNIDDAGAVKEIEAGLLHLMEEFQAGNLAAFGKDSRLRQMEAIREQQESLARLHQEVGVRQDLYQPLSTEGLLSNSEHMSTIMGKLECLSEAIENLHSNASCDRKASTTLGTAPLPTTSGADTTGTSHAADDGDTITSDDREDTVDDGSANVELRKKHDRATLHKTSSLGGVGSGRENGTAEVTPDTDSLFLDRSRSGKGRAASFARSSSQKHIEYSRAAAAAVTVTRGNSFTNGVSPGVQGHDMSNRSRSKSKGKKNTETEDKSSMEQTGKTKLHAKNEEQLRHRHRKHNKERDGVQTGAEPFAADASCFSVPSLNAGSDFRDSTEMKQFSRKKAHSEREPSAATLEHHQFITSDTGTPDFSRRTDPEAPTSEPTHPSPPFVEPRRHHHQHHPDRQTRHVSKKPASAQLHHHELSPLDLQRPSPTPQRQPPFVPARPSRTAPTPVPGSGHPCSPKAENESPGLPGRSVKSSSSRSTPQPLPSIAFNHHT